MECCNFFIGVLSILTTVLLAWQIINVVFFEKRIRRAIKKSEKRMKKSIEKTEYKISGYSILSPALSSAEIQPEHSFVQFVYAAEYLYLYDNECEDVDLCLEQLNNIIPKINKKRLSKIGEIREDLLRALFSLKNEKSKEVIHFLLSLSNNQSQQKQ